MLECICYVASEWKSFLLFYIPATLYDVLHMKYYAHVFLLIKAIRILLSEYIEHKNLALADQLLTKFCKLMEQYYGEFLCTIKHSKEKTFAVFVDFVNCKYFTT